MDNPPLPYPNYNLIRYEYSVCDTSYGMTYYYVRLLYRYYPNNIEYIYDWFTLIGEEKLELIGLQLIPTHGGGRKLVIQIPRNKICLIHKFQVPTPLVLKRYIYLLVAKNPVYWDN